MFFVVHGEALDQDFTSFRTTKTQVSPHNPLSPQVSGWAKITMEALVGANALPQLQEIHEAVQVGQSEQAAEKESALMTPSAETSGYSETKLEVHEVSRESASESVN